MRHFSNFSRLAPYRYLTLKQTDWTNWDREEFRGFAFAIAKVLGGVSEQDIAGEPPSAQTTWDERFRTVQREAGLRVWLSQLRADRGCQPFDAGTFTGQESGDYYPSEETVKHSSLPNGELTTFFWKTTDPLYNDEIYAQSKLVEDRRQKLVQEINKHVVVDREYLKHLGDGRRKHPLPEDTDDGYKLQHLTHQMYLAATERANKATELFVVKEQELAAITCDQRKLFQAHRRLLVEAPVATATTGDAQDTVQDQAAEGGRAHLRDVVLPPPTPPEVWSTRALALVDDGEFLPKSWLQTSEQYLQQEASLSRSTKPWVKHVDLQLPPATNSS